MGFYVKTVLVTLVEGIPDRFCSSLLVGIFRSRSYCLTEYVTFMLNVRLRHISIEIAVPNGKFFT